MPQPPMPRNWSWIVLRPTRTSRANTKKDVLFIIGDWNAKVGSCEILGVTGKFGFGVQNEAGQSNVLPRECTGHSIETPPTTRGVTLHMDIIRWSILKSDWSYYLQPEELWTEVCNIVQEAVIKTMPRKKKCKKAKWLSEEALQITEKKREVKGKGEKVRYTHLNGEF